MIQYADYVVAPITHGILVELFVKPSILKEVTDKAVTEKLLKELPAVLDFLEQTLAKDKRTWIADTKDFSLADIALVSHLVTLKTAHLSLENLIGKDRPFLLNYVKKALDRASFKKALLL
jgi:glutathione S-transferase